MSKYRVEYSLAHADLGPLWKVTSPDHDIHYFHTWSNALAYANRVAYNESAARAVEKFHNSVRKWLNDVNDAFKPLGKYFDTDT